MNLLALTEQDIGKPITGIGTIGDPGGDGATLLSKVLSTVIGALTIVAAIYFMFNLITGALAITSAGGDKGQVEDARRKMTNGFIGLVITIAAMFIMDIVAKLLGIPSILDLGAMINNISQL